MQHILPILKHVDSFRVSGLSTRTQNTDEFDDKTAKLPALWQAFYAGHTVTDTNILGVYSEYASDAHGYYTVTVGSISDSDQSPLCSVTIETGNYLVFRGKGPMPLAVIETWKRIWQCFASEDSYQRNYMTDFEMYKNGDEVDIYIGVA